MEKADLLAALNAERGGAGRALVTDRLLRDWIDEDLIVGASPTGRKRGANPIWTYSAHTLDAATQIVALRDRKIRRVSLIRIYLWAERRLEYSDLVRRSFISEFGRFARRQNRTNRIDYDARCQASLDERATARVDRQLGRADRDLEAAGLVPPSPLLRTIGSAANWGASTTLPSDFIEHFGTILSKGAQNSELFMRAFLSGISGIIGPADETTESGLKIISKECKYDDLKAGRAFYNSAVMSLSLGKDLIEAPEAARVAWRKAERSLQEPDFLVSFIGLGAIAAIRARKSAETK